MSRRRYKMRNVRYKPSKPTAVFGIVFGIGLLGFGISIFRDDEGGRGLLVFWCLLVVAVTAFHTWAAFSKNGFLATLVLKDDDGSTDRR